tara:strand:+ start:454 stop:870 length:417 start_codon:yes stop_codon:yes gene_type:complete
LKQFITQTKENMRKRIIVFIVILIVAIISYMYIYQDHRNIKNEVAQYKLTSNEIALQFSENYKNIETKYLNTTIEVTGKVSENDSNSITLDDKVFCQFNKTIKRTVVYDSKIKIKGRVIGYDDLLQQVKLDQCSINEY